MAEVKKTSTNKSKDSNSKRSSNSSKVTPHSTTKSGTGPGNKHSNHKK